MNQEPIDLAVTEHIHRRDMDYCTRCGEFDVARQTTCAPMQPHSMSRAFEPAVKVHFPNEFERGPIVA
jgi:hypothetical protein